MIHKIKRFLYYLLHKPSVLAVMLVEIFTPLIPDKLYLQLQYRFVVGKRLDLKNPVTFGEKIQWLKLYNRKPEYTIMVDKVKVKQYVEEKLGKECIIPNLGVWESPEEIDFDALPNQFVLKCNHNSGTGMYICKDKRTLDIEKVKAGLRKGLKENYFLHGREWPYKDVPRRILAEKFMVDDNVKELKDYKFFCFGGIPRLCQVISDRNTDMKIDFYDMEWNRVVGLVEFAGLAQYVQNSDNDIARPRSFDDMKRMAAVLSAEIPFARIDFYDIQGKAYFGEITFFPTSGFVLFSPDEWNERLGNLIEIPLS